MSETTPEPAVSEPPSPKKKGCGKKRYFLFPFLLTAGLVYLTCPWLNGMQKSVAVSGGAMQSRIDSLDQRIHNLENSVRTLQAIQGSPSGVLPVNPQTAPPSLIANDLTRVQGDMATLSSAMGALQSEVKLSGANAAETRDASAAMLAAAVAFIELREAELDAHAFANELAQLREASSRDPALLADVAKLEPYAATGVACVATLRNELILREPSVMAAVAKGEATSWWQRVLAELHSLISVRPLQGGQSEVLANVEAALAKGSASAAVEAYKSLPAEAQSSLADWQAKLETRLHLDEAMAAVSAHFTVAPPVKTP